MSDILDRDEMKLDSLMGKLTVSAAEKIQAKAETLKDTYGVQNDTTYDFGLQKQLTMKILLTN